MRRSHWQCRAALLGTLLFSVGLAQGAEQDTAQRLLNEQRERERVERLQQDAPHVSGGEMSKAQDALAAHPEQIEDVEPSFEIGQIELAGNSLLSERQVHALVAPYLGLKLGRNRINALLRRVTSAYIERGYITARVYLGEQNLAKGKLVLSVIEGRIEKITLNDAEAPSSMLIAFPVAEGDLLRLQDLEQGVDQLNRLRANRAEMQILPGQTPGGSVLALKNNPSDHLHYSVGGDNLGSQSTGRARIRVGVDADNLTGLQEASAVSYVTSKDSNALVFSESLPWGYNTFSYTYAYSESQTLVAGTALMFSDSRTQTLAWNRLIQRSANGKTALDLSVNHRTSRRFVNDAALTPQRLSAVRLSANRMERFSSGVAMLDLGVSKGVPWFNANHDAPGIAREAAHARFRKIELNSSLQLMVGQDWMYRGSLAGQWTGKALYSTEQLFLGGSGSQRGSEEGALAGDRGLSMRNEMTYLTGWRPEFWHMAPTLQPLVFVDAGQVELVAQPGWERLASAGVGLRVNQGGLSAELLVGKPWQAPDGVRRATLGHFTMSYSF